MTTAGMRAVANHFRKEAKTSLVNILCRVYDVPNLTEVPGLEAVASKLVDSIVQCAMSEVAAAVKESKEQGDHQRPHAN